MLYSAHPTEEASHIQAIQDVQLPPGSMSWTIQRRHMYVYMYIYISTLNDVDDEVGFDYRPEVWNCGSAWRNFDARFSNSLLGSSTLGICLILPCATYPAVGVAPV